MTASRAALGARFWSRALVAPATAAAGGAFAVLTVLLNHADSPILRGVASVVGSATGWAAAGVAVGWVAFRRTSSLPRTIGLCTVFLLGATCAYYLADYLVDVTTSVPLPPGLPVPPGWDEFTPRVSVGELVFWSLASLLCGPLCAVVVWLAHRRGIPGLLGRLCIPVGLALWSGVLLLTPTGAQPEPALLAAQGVAVVVGGVAAGALLVRHLR